MLDDNDKNNVLSKGVSHVDKDGRTIITTFDQDQYYHNSPVDFDAYKEYKSKQTDLTKQVAKDAVIKKQKKAVEWWWSRLTGPYKTASLKSLYDMRPHTARQLQKVLKEIDDKLKNAKPVRLPNLVINRKESYARGRKFVAYVYLNYLVSVGLIDDPKNQIMVINENTLVSRLVEGDWDMRSRFAAALNNPMLRIIFINDIKPGFTEFRESKRSAAWDRLIDEVDPSKVSFVLTFDTVDGDGEDKRAKTVVDAIVPVLPLIHDGSANDGLIPEGITEEDLNRVKCIAVEPTAGELDRDKIQKTGSLLDQTGDAGLNIPSDDADEDSKKTVFGHSKKYPAYSEEKAGEQGLQRPSMRRSIRVQQKPDPVDDDDELIGNLRRK